MRRRSNVTITKPEQAEVPAPGMTFGRRSRATEVHERLRHLIVSGQLTPGTPITELEVTARFAVSRTPAREALQRLEQQGYIVASDQGKQLRMVVAPLTKEDARELYGLIGELEGLASRWAAELGAKRRGQLAQELLRLHEALSKFSGTEAANAGRIFDLDLAFHRRYMDAAGGRRLRTLHEAISSQRERYLRVYASTLFHRVSAPVAEHLRILEAIRRGEPDRAQRAVQSHYRHAVKRLYAVIEATGERGHW